MAALLFSAACVPGFCATPANDNFTDRTVVTGSSITINGTLAGATLESEESGPPFNSSSGGSVWYSWTAAQSTRVVVELVRDWTSFSSSNTAFTVFTGGAIDALMSIDSNTLDWPPGRYAAFVATAGTPYQFRVAGGWSGAFTLKLTATNPPVFLQQPVDCVVSPYGSAFFSALAAGPRSGNPYAPAMRYQWLSNGIAIPGQTGASLLVHGATTNCIASYSVVASNAGGLTASLSATFSIIDTNSVPGLSVLASPPPGNVGLMLTGEAGRWYQVESSQDLKKWPGVDLYPTTNLFWFENTNQTLSVTIPRLAPVHFIRASLNVRTDVCMGQLKQMNWAQRVAAIDSSLRPGFSVPLDQLKPYIPLSYLNGITGCPERGYYMAGMTFTNPVTCTIGLLHGHVVAGP